MRIGIVDYGAGNLQSVRGALVALGAEPTMVTTADEVLASDRLILPGVGAAGVAMQRLRDRGLDEALHDAVHGKGRPMLGICLGLQLLAERLHEFGDHAGLGWIPGEVVSLSCLTRPEYRVPHVGWNQVELQDGAPSSLLAAVPGQREFYFCHSYALIPSEPGVVAATTDYGVPLVAAVQIGTVFATQFHPEKSQINGERLLKAFLDWKP